MNNSQPNYQLRPIVLLLILTSSFSVFSQKEVRLYDKAEEQLSDHQYTEALEYYQEVQEISPGFGDVDYKISICSYLSGAKDDDGLADFQQFENTYGSTDDHYYYWLGQIYLRRYSLEEANKAFEKFQQKVSYTGGADKDESAEKIAHAQQLKAFFDNPDNYSIHQLESPINSASAELSPVYFEDENELLFASNRGKSGETPFVIYYSKSGPNGWEAPVELANLGSFGRKNANIEVVNEDGKLFLFRDDNGGDLYYSQASGAKWTTPVEFDARVSNNHIASHFFINEHEDRIIFASDEGDDGLDIYESFRDPANGKWSRPSAFYSSINSEFNEDSPYLSPDEQTLYFCSDRPGGIGGFDVYKSTYNPDDYSWSEPENMGWPINSPNDEFHFKMNADQTSGYFVSNRLHTKGDYDIYFFWEVEKVKIQGRIFDNQVNGPLTNAEIRFHPSQYLDEYFVSKIDQTGRYSTKIISDEIFKVEILLDGQVIHEEKFEIHDTSGEPTTHIKDFAVR
ncbi:hypothetical protein [Marinoscillum sp.]|uniref:hypothetical protein n=1 Tax=Marinoscillum sp. TaxID=2024838 RepID=UPI003BAAC661